MKVYLVYFPSSVYFPFLCHQNSKDSDSFHLFKFNHMCCKIVKINVTIVKIIQYYTILYHTILYYTIPSILAIKQSTWVKIFPKINQSSQHTLIFWIDLTNFESKIGAEDQFWEESPISNINPSNQVTVMKHSTSSSSLS